MVFELGYTKVALQLISLTERRRPAGLFTLCFCIVRGPKHGGAEDLSRQQEQRQR